MSDDENKPPKRSRSSNYTQQEKNLLLNIVLRFKHVIESKKTDAVTWREKNTTWIKITNMFNSQSPSGIHRDVASLKKVYENIKKNVRKTVADEKVSIKSTGGGEGYFNNDPNVDLALEVMNPKTVYGISNHFDSDSQCDKQNEGIEVTVDQDFHNNTEVEAVVIVMEDDLDTAAVESVDWGDLKTSSIRTPVNKKLKPKPLTLQKKPTNTKTEELSTDQNFSVITNEPSTSWSAKRRPITTALSSSDISKKYMILADMKIELVKKELEQLETSRIRKDEREEIEFNLRKKSLELDNQIKGAILEKIASLSNPVELLSFLR